MAKAHPKPNRWNFKDIEGQRFGKLVAVRYAGTNRHQQATWQCRCDCGGKSIVASNTLLRGLTKSCGCGIGTPGNAFRRSKLVGRRFGRLLVLRLDDVVCGHSLWMCRCDCGTIKSISGSSLIQGHASSCGCLLEETYAGRISNLTGSQFGQLTVMEFHSIRKRRAHWKCRCECGEMILAKGHDLLQGCIKHCGCGKGTHKMSKSPEYRIWCGMRRRCEDANASGYHRYGGRGIAVCGRWKRSFANFISDMGPRPSLSHSIDRYPNNDGNYEPSNCRWATPKEQGRNKSQNRLVKIGNATRCVAEWCEMSGLSYLGFLNRVRKYGESEAMVLAPRHSSIRIVVDGHEKSVGDWAKCVGLNATSIYARLKKGWPPALAVMIPAACRDRLRKRQL